MARFEVVLPPAPPDQPFEVKLRVESDTWLGALKVGLERICGGAVAEQVMCDVSGDHAMEVADPRTGRTFRIVELGAVGSVGSADAPARAAKPAPAARPAKPAAAQASAAAAPRAPRTADERAREDLLADLFLRAPKALARAAKPDDALGAVLDLALEKVGCEAAVAWSARASQGVLTSAATRGGRGAPAPLEFGRGVAGFCAQELVCLAVSDPAKDPLFRTGAGAPPRTVLCAPIAVGNRVFGVLELADKRAGAFGEQDVAVAQYLAHQAARWLDARDAAQP